MLKNERLEEIRRATEQIRALGEKAVEVVKAQGDAMLDAQQQQLKVRRQQLEQAVKDATNFPKPIDHANDLSSMPPVVMTKWGDNYGNTVYTDRPTGISLVKTLLGRILAQQSALGQLSPEEQSRIRAEFDSSNGTAVGTQSYKDLLQNEALGRRFDELKQNPPRPFDNK